MVFNILIRAQNGGMLQPPMGFTLNATSWPKFLAKTLKDAIYCPSRCVVQDHLLSIQVLSARRLLDSLWWSTFRKPHEAWLNSSVHDP
jgi:hypothetical protein